jgi:hypothetical protein
MMVAILLCVYRGFVIFSPEISEEPGMIRKELQPGHRLLPQLRGASIVFYTGEQCISLTRAARGSYGSPSSPMFRVFEDQNSFDQLWNGPNRSTCSLRLIR